MHLLKRAPERGSNSSRKRNQSEAGKRKKGARFVKRQQRTYEGGVFSKNTHVLRNHTRGVRLWGGETHESEWMRSGRRDMNDKEEEGRQRQENLVPASNNLCQRGDVKQE